MKKRFCLEDINRPGETLCITVNYGGQNSNIVGWSTGDFNNRINFDNCLEVLEYAVCEGDYSVGDTLAFSNVVDPVDGEYFVWSDDITEENIDNADGVIDFIYRFTHIKTIN